MGNLNADAALGWQGNRQTEEIIVPLSGDAYEAYDWKQFARVVRQISVWQYSKRVVMPIMADFCHSGLWQWLPTEASGFTIERGVNTIVAVAVVDEPYRLVNRFVSLLQKTDRFRFVGFDVALFELYKWMHIAGIEFEVSPSTVRPNWLPQRISPGFQRAAEGIHALSEDIIEQRQAKLAAAEDDQHPRDMLSLLLRAESDPEVT